MNSTLLLIVILGLPLAAAPPAQDPDMTCGQENGRAWHDMDSPTKVGFILGLRATMAHLAIRGVVDLEQRHRYLVDQLTFGETARAVDRFYETPENMPIPILWAMEVIANRGGVVVYPPPRRRGPPHDDRTDDRLLPDTADCLRATSRRTSHANGRPGPRPRRRAARPDRQSFLTL